MWMLVGPTNRTVTLTGSPMGATVETGGEIMVPKLKLYCQLYMHV